jgi:hypothetical protein
VTATEATSRSLVPRRAATAWEPQPAMLPVLRAPALG